MLCSRPEVSFSAACAAGPGALIFLLAHQDDELMVAPIIADAKRQGRPVGIYYLTNGDGGGAPPETRNKESLRLLARLGVSCTDEVMFLGDRLAISDGTLHRRLSAIHQALVNELRSRHPIATIFTHAWEGGNPDHDAAHALALGVSSSLGLASIVRQVAFYRAPRSGWLPFVLFCPLPANGAVTYYPVRFLDRIKRLLLARFFPSQLRTFVRFFPLLLIDAFSRPGVPMQRAAASRLVERPMPERLRYERIGYIEFSALSAAIDGYWRSLAEVTSGKAVELTVHCAVCAPLSDGQP